jgi:hypothetical protein
MAVIELDRVRLSQSLRPLAGHQRGAFAVSCAQRLAACFLDSPSVQQERPDDLRLAQQVLAELWTAAATDIPERLGPLVGELERMPELTADRQWHGRGAYQTHALAAMLYAGRSWQEQSPNYAVQCAQCVFDAALFLDRRLDPAPVDPLSESVLRALVEDGRAVPDPSGPFQPRELRRQREDLAGISAADPEEWETVVAQMRGASEAYSREFLAALESTFT